MARKTNNQEAKNQQVEQQVAVEETPVTQTAQTTQQTAQVPVDAVPYTNEQMHNIAAGVAERCRSNEQLPPFFIPGMNGCQQPAEQITQWGTIGIPAQTPTMQVPPVAPAPFIPQPSQPIVPPIYNQNQTVQQVPPQTQTPEQKVDAKQETSNGPKWDLGDIIEKDIFMRLNFPQYCDDQKSRNLNISLIFYEACKLLDINDYWIDTFLINSSKIKKYGPMTEFANNVSDIEASKDNSIKGLKHTLYWISVYSIVYTNYIMNKKSATEIASMTNMSQAAIDSVIKLIDTEIEEKYYLPIDRCALDSMGVAPTFEKPQIPQGMDLGNVFAPIIDQAFATCKTDEEEDKGEQKVKEIDNIRNLLDIMERHLANKLTPQDITDLKENVKDWEKDIEKLSEMLNNLPALDLKTEVPLQAD